jgi:hypothetical protein
MRTATRSSKDRPITETVQKFLILVPFLMLGEKARTVGTEWLKQLYRFFYSSLRLSGDFRGLAAFGVHSRLSS